MMMGIFSGFFSGKWKEERGKRYVCSRVFSLLFPLSSFLLFLTSCEAEAPVSRKYVCRFVFSYKDHATSLLFAAAQNPGTYVYVTTKGDGKNSVRHVYVNSNFGLMIVLVRIAPTCRR